MLTSQTAAVDRKFIFANGLCRHYEFACSHIRFGCNDMWMLIGDELLYGRFTFVLWKIESGTFWMYFFITKYEDKTSLFSDH